MILPILNTISNTIRYILRTLVAKPCVTSMGPNTVNVSTMTIAYPTGEISPARRDFETNNVNSESSYGHSPANLHNIREQMALSLERTKELEEMVKIIPSLQVYS